MKKINIQKNQKPRLKTISIDCTVFATKTIFTILGTAMHANSRVLRASSTFLTLKSFFNTKEL